MPGEMPSASCAQTNIYNHGEVGDKSTMAETPRCSVDTKGGSLEQFPLLRDDRRSQEEGGLGQELLRRIGTP